MKPLKAIVLFVSVFGCLSPGYPATDAEFNEIYRLFKQNNYFAASGFYAKNKTKLPEDLQWFTEATLDNAFNRLSESEGKIKALATKNIADSLKFRLFELKYDNAVKQYRYADARDAIANILKNYASYLSKQESEDYLNELKIWSVLENIPPQTTNIRESTTLKMEKDKAGLKNLSVTVGDSAQNFIFDTGANISTVSLSAATKLNMKIIPSDIEVGTITGSKVKAQMGVCNKLALGNINFSNVIFLVLPDSALAFPQINYQIPGILGFPVIEALKEIQITKDDTFIVPKTETSLNGNPNMALNRLTPLIFVNEKHFTFDSGADHTLLYHRYYAENKEEIEKNYKPARIAFGGAGGNKQFDGFTIDYTIAIGDKLVKLKNVTVVKEKIKDSETVYGNIGQDLIKSFDKMTLNFDKMFIRFD